MLMIKNETINHAIDYILQHINEELSVDDVAAYCHFSKYHFSRMFKEETGESVYAFIKRLKLEQSAFRLKVEPNRTVTDIGTDTTETVADETKEVYNEMKKRNEV